MRGKPLRCPWSAQSKRTTNVSPHLLRVHNMRHRRNQDHLFRPLYTSYLEFGSARDKKSRKSMINIALLEISACFLFTDRQTGAAE
jgi:hypothetical protein